MRLWVRSTVLSVIVALTLAIAPSVTDAGASTVFACTLVSTASVSRVMGRPWVLARALSESIASLEKADGPQPSFGRAVPIAASGCVWKVKGTAFSDNEIFNVSVLQYSAPLTSADVTKIGKEFISEVGVKGHRQAISHVGQWEFVWPPNGLIEEGTGRYVISIASGDAVIPQWTYGKIAQLARLALDKLSFDSHV